MERLLNKYEHKYKKAQECVAQWNSLQDQIVRLFSNAAAVIQRLPLLLKNENYGALQELKANLVAKQAESLEKIFMAMRDKLSEMEVVCKSLEKLCKDGNNLLKNEKPKPTKQQIQMRVASRASLQDCVNGLNELYIMHRDEYSLKADIISSLTYDTKPYDISAFQTVLADQPNIPRDEVQSIFDLVFAGN